jgi:hypothetical protein
VGDIKKFAADVVALKYAQDFHGADEAVALALAGGEISKTALHPKVGEHVFVETKGDIKAPHALFVGVPPLWELSYTHIRSLSAHALSALAAEEPDARSFAMTVHGVNAGLDEVEAALAQFGGFLDSIRAGRFPPALEKISIVDKDKGRVERLRAAFAQAFKIADYATRTGGDGWAYRLRVVPARGGSKKKAQSGKKVQSFAAHRAAAAAAVIEKAGTKAKAKPHVFVAMPFKEEMGDVFSYGIQNSVHTIDYLCERIDQEAFTGDILDRLKNRIETASLVIADLTDDNPNVFLEVGYAWGKGRPTLLVVRDDPNKPLRFDVQGQHCIKYRTIKSLETALTKMLSELKKDGTI